MNKSIPRWSRTAVAAAAMAVATATAAYASNPVPDEKVALAQASIARAEQAGAPQAAPVELAAARDKLARAQKAIADRDLKPAVMWAEQADIDARVAEATAQLQRSEKAATEFDVTMQALRQESLRSSPSAQ